MAVSGWLEALSAPDLEIWIAGNHYAATQTMDEEQRQNVTFMGGFNVDGPVCRSIRKADENTVSFSAILLKPGQDAGMDDESFLYGLGANIRLACRRGANSWHVYEAAAWTSIKVSSTLEQVTLNADFSVPSHTPPKR